MSNIVPINVESRCDLVDLPAVIKIVADNRLPPMVKKINGVIDSDELVVTFDFSEAGLTILIGVTRGVVFHVLEVEHLMMSDLAIE